MDDHHPPGPALQCPLGPAEWPDPRVSNGRAPDWATHYAIIINWQNIRQMDPAAPPPLYLTDFYANVL